LRQVHRTKLAGTNDRYTNGAAFGCAGFEFLNQRHTFLSVWFSNALAGQRVKPPTCNKQDDIA
jgi:hypothetical protein